MKNMVIHDLVTKEINPNGFKLARFQEIQNIDDRWFEIEYFHENQSLKLIIKNISIKVDLWSMIKRLKITLESTFNFVHSFAV